LGVGRGANISSPKTISLLRKFIRNLGHGLTLDNGPKRKKHQLFVDFKKAYDSIRREVIYNILIEFGVPVKLVRPIKMCLNETNIKVPIGAHLSDNFPIQNGLK
jgi:hypothetical protein